MPQIPYFLFAFFIDSDKINVLRIKLAPYRDAYHIVQGGYT